MRLNKLYGTFQKARNSTKIIFHPTGSTTSFPGELLEGRDELFHATRTSNGKFHTSIDRQPCTAFSFKERHIHTSVCKHLCSKEKEESDSVKDINNTLKKNEQDSTQNNKVKINKSPSCLMKKRGFYKIRHQNLVWDGSNKRNRMNKIKMSVPISEKNKELAEKKLNSSHSMLNRMSELNSDKEKQNTEMLKTHNSSEKNVLTIDIFTDSQGSDNLHLQKMKTISEDSKKASSKIDTTITSAIENSDRLISFKANENRKNNWKIINNKSLITESTIKDSTKNNLILLNQNSTPMNESVLQKKYELHKKTKNMDEDNSVISNNKDCSINISDKILTDNRPFKITKNVLPNKNSTELTKLEDFKLIFCNRPKAGNIENKENLDEKINTCGNEQNQTVWDTKYRQRKFKVIPSHIQYHIDLLNKINRKYKNINLNNRYKFANSINSILRPVKAKTEVLNDRYDYQLLPKNLYVPVLPSIKPTRNIAQHMSHQSNLVMDNTLYLKSMKSGTSRLNEHLQNRDYSNSLLNVSKDKPWDKMQLIKEINSANFNKKSKVADLKNEIKSWKSYERLKKVVLESTSEIYQSIMHGRKIRKNTKNIFHTPKEKIQQKCSVISIPLAPNVDFNKFQKQIQTKMRKNSLKNKNSFSTVPDPIMMLNAKYKKQLNYHIPYNELVNKNEMVINMERFKESPEILDHIKKNSFQTEEKPEVMDNFNKDISKKYRIKKPEGKTAKVFTKNAKKITMYNKKPWVRYMHQMNDESKGESSTVTDINTYPSGCLKKPEFIIELLPLSDEPLTEVRKLSEFINRGPQTNKGSLNSITNRSDSMEGFKLVKNDTLEKKLENSITTEYHTNKLKLHAMNKEYKDTQLNKRKDKPMSFSDSCKMNYDKIHGYKYAIVCKQEHNEPEKKYLNHKTNDALRKSALDQEHCLSYECFEDNEPKQNTNEVNKDLTIEEVKGLIDIRSKKPLKIYNSGEFQTKITFDNKTNHDSDSIKLNKDLSDNNKTYIFKTDQCPNNIKVEVCTNVELPIQNTFNSLVVPKGNKTASVLKQHPKHIDSTVYNQQNPVEFLKTDISNEIKPRPLKPSSQQRQAIEISFSSSQLEGLVLEEPMKPKKTQIEQLDERINNSCNNQLSLMDYNLPHSKLDQHKSIPYNDLGHCSSIQTKMVGKEISNSSNNKNLAKQVHEPLLILSSDKKEVENRSCLETQTTVSETDVQTSKLNKSLENTLDAQQSNSINFENIRADIKELFGFMKKSGSEDTIVEISNKKAFIENIKEFFRSSYNYFKLGNNESEVSTHNSLPNLLHQSKDKINRIIFSEIDHVSKQPTAFPEINKRSHISSECDKIHLHPKQINNNIEGNKPKLLPSPILKHEKDNLSLMGNEEFKIRFSKMLPITQKGEFQTTSKELEHGIPNEEISINHFEKGMYLKTTCHKKNALKTDNILGISNHHSNFLNKVNEKDFENFPVNQVKQQRSFCNLNHKKCNMKFSSKNKSFSKKTKQRISKANVINIKSKLGGFHYPLSSKGPLEEIPNLVNMRENSCEINPFNWKIGLKPIKNSSKLKENQCYKLFGDVALQQKSTEKSDLLTIKSSVQKQGDRSNPESYRLNCLSESIYTQDKLSRNKFLTYIKKRKLPRKMSVTSIN